MSKLDNKDSDKKIMKVLTCEYFNHKLNPHVHDCGNAVNKSKRCGYDVSDINDCPIKGKIVEKDIRASKSITSIRVQDSGEGLASDKSKEQTNPEASESKLSSDVVKSEETQEIKKGMGQPSISVGKTTNVDKLLVDPSSTSISSQKKQSDGKVIRKENL